MQNAVNIANWEKQIREYAAVAHISAEQSEYKMFSRVLYAVARRLVPSKQTPSRNLADYFNGNIKYACRVVARTLRARATGGAYRNKSEYLYRRARTLRKMGLSTEQTRAEIRKIEAAYDKNGGRTLYTRHLTRKGVTGEYFVMQNRGRTLYALKGRTAHYYTRDLARKYAESNARRRASAFKFCYVIPRAAQEEIIKEAKRLGFDLGRVQKKGKAISKNKPSPYVSIIAGNEGDARTNIQLRSTYVYRSDKTAAGLPTSGEYYTKEIRACLPEAIAEAIADTEQYIQRKLDKLAQQLTRKHSTRRARSQLLRDIGVRD